MTEQNELKMLNFKEIGRRIKVEREAAHLTRESFAGKINLTPKFVADIEYGDRGMSLHTLYKIMQVLEQSADYILSGNEFKDKKERVEIQRLKENILGPLSNCTVEQLKCMEQIARYYVEGLSSKEE